MEKCLKFLYYACLGVFVSGVVFLTTMLFVSPRQDALKRGFIPCTEKLVVDISMCERGEILCPLKHLWQDTKCNGGVVFSGFGAWIKGEQSTPWENYLFKPQLEIKTDEQTPYNGDAVRDMDYMEQQRLFIAAKHAELEEAKNRQLDLNENVLILNPEEEIPSEDIKKALKKDELLNEKADDISDEVFEEKNWDDSSEKKEYIKPKEDIIKNIRQKTAEQLHERELKDEK